MTERWRKGERLRDRGRVDREVEAGRDGEMDRESERGGIDRNMKFN